MSARDPKLDPRPGDVLQGPGPRGKKRTVMYVSIADLRPTRRGRDKRFVIYDTPTRTQLRCAISGWRAWAKTAAVVRKGPEIEARHRPGAFSLSESVVQQMRWLDNKYVESKIGWPEHSCAGAESVLLALIELGVETAAGTWDGKQRFFHLLRHQVVLEKQLRALSRGRHKESCDMGVDCGCGSTDTAEVAARPEDHEP